MPENFNPVRFVVHTVPVAQPRQRTRGFVTKSGRVATQNYTPTKHPVNVFKAAVQSAFADAYQGAPLDGPLRLRLLFVMPRPESMNRKRGVNPRVPDERKKNDVDNLSKSLMDALKHLAWADDGQVSDSRIKKRVAAATEQPHVVVVIERDEIEEEESDEVGSQSGVPVESLESCGGGGPESHPQASVAEHPAGSRQRHFALDGPRE